MTPSEPPRDLGLRILAEVTGLNVSDDGRAIVVRQQCAASDRADTKDLEAGEVKIPTNDGEMPAYRAMPAGAGPFGL